MVIDPGVLTREIDELRQRGIDVGGLRISANAHLIMPYHVKLDTAGELKLGKLEIGTTRRGIGPCYADKAFRLGIRVQDLLDEKILRKKIMAAMEPKQQMLRPFAKDPELDLHTMTETYLTYGHRLEPHIADTAKLCWDALDGDRTVLFEEPRERCSTSTTAPIRSSPPPIPWPAPPASARGSALRHRRGLGDREGLLDPGRLRALPDRARG